ncbi:sucrose transporter [Trichoderma arundinaceum]|uniref:Sucrose transporter n=1 Tax=Trichoderma arundinaceum TaxID=490622 RepID=A0A395N8A9_TRIAR|nr:sucrose transporter [Trichoderma arundinaceum]
MGHDADADNVPLMEKSTVSDVIDDELSDETPSRWDFLIHTIPFFGLQLAYTVQQVFGIPYLSSLGVPDTQLPIFVMSGPLAGFVVPPVIAVFSDTIRSPWGKRKPFIFLGGFGIILSFLFLASAQPLAETLAPHASVTVSHIIAGLSIYTLNFAIQPLQLGLRASVIDHFKPNQQVAANLWISRLQSLGSVFVALVGLGYSPAFWDLSIAVVCVLVPLLGIVAFTNNMKPGPQWSDHKSAEPAAHYEADVPDTAGVMVCMVLGSSLLKRSALTSASESESSHAVAREALLFHIASLTTLVMVSLVWNPSNGKDRTKIQLDANSDEKDESGTLYTKGLSHIRDVLMRWVWKPSLVALAVSLIATCLLASLSTPSPFPITAITLLLGANGIFFALANWVPNALIAHEATAQAWSREMIAAEEDTVDEEDDTPMLLAVHNMAITVPQIMASIVSWLLLQGLAVLGLQQDIVWIFAICIPPALWAACL